jgi:hypothetical protein
MLIWMTVILLVVTDGCRNDQSQRTVGTAPIKERLASPPEIESVPVSVRDLKPVEKETFHAEVERRMQARFPNADWFRASDATVSPGWAMYHFKTDDEQVMLQIFFGDSAKEAARQLRELDLTISFRQGFEAIAGIGDEAYTYGPTGSFLARYSNILVSIGSKSPDQRQQVAKLIVEAVDEILKEEDLP